MYKRIEFSSVGDLGRTFAEAIDITPRGGGLEKIAGQKHPEVERYLRTLRPDPRYQYVLMTPMGAFEYWGMNVNGDVFPELALAFDMYGRQDPMEVARKLEERWLAPFGKRIPPGNYREFGHKTFLQAERYRHHVNKDPSKSYGGIVLSVYNPTMHRVEVIVRHDREKAKRVGAEEIICDLDEGKPRQISMGCKVPFDVCFRGDTLIKTARGMRPIAALEVGDRVYTREGTLRSVTQTYERDFDDAMVTLKVDGTLPLTLTRNHPVFVIPKKQVRDCQGSTSASCTTCGQGSLRVQERAAEDVQLGDYMVTPICTEGGQSFGPSLAYVLGVYAGGGSRIRQRRGCQRDGEYVLQGLQFSCEAEDPHLDRLRGAIAELASNELNTYDEGDKKAVSVRVCDQELAKIVTEAVPGTAREKRLAVWLSDQDDRLAFLAGLVDSYGHYNAEKGCARIVCTSKALLLSAWHVALRAGLHASLESYTAVNGFSGEPVEVYQLFLPVTSTAALQAYSSKVRDVPEKRARHNGFFYEISGTTYYCRAVTAVASEDDACKVYNIAVDESESYIAEGLAVHNCTKCGHISRTPRDYCSHLRMGMGSINADGSINGAVNFFPRFFDLSDVFVPAAKESGVLMKVASARGATKTSATNKKADIKKELLPNTGKPSVGDVSNCEPDLPMSKLHGIELGDLLSTLSSLGIILKPHEFQHTMLHRMGLGRYGDELNRRRMVFRPRHGSSHMSLSSGRFLPRLAEMLSGMLGDRSGFRPHLPRRVIRVTVLRAEPPPARKEAPDSEPLRKVAEAYDTYRKSLRGLPGLIDVAVRDHPGYYSRHFFSELLTDSMEKMAGPTHGSFLSTSLVPVYVYSAYRNSVEEAPPHWELPVATHSPARALIAPTL